MPAKKTSYKRFNTRIREDQQTFIKKKAKKEGVTEGDVLRGIIDSYISSVTAKKNV
jgi:predicted DNA binding CopG/RHH family protein